MKSTLKIYSNENLNKFLKTFFREFELTFTNLQSIDYDAHKSQAKIIFINNIEEAKLINFKKLDNNFLIISRLKNDYLNINQKIKVISSPISINYFKNTIVNFIQNITIQFHDISIDNEKLINLNNNYFCYLTKAELEILSYLIKERETTKDFIKENILKIKSNIETNSLESHLTRIRKKMNKIKTNIKIKTKNEKLLITI
tara:strand:+ start:134 stop:736 length:603 start_codon:yes stop_codon:yes gene_type:complete